MLFASAWLVGLSLASASQVPLMAHGTLEGCLREAGIRFDLPSDENYTLHRQVFQRETRFQFKPAAIAFPTSQDQVAQVVKCAKKLGYPVSARSGGHSAIAGSLGGRDGVLVVDLGAFDDLKVDQETKVAAIGGGLHLGPAYLELFKQGQRYISGGACANIGVGGMLAHGGYSILHRHHGLAVDNVVAYDLVLPSGEQLTNVTSESHPELFWGLKGFAPNFAIVTRFYVQTYDASRGLTVLSPHWIVGVDEAVDLVMKWQKWTNSPYCKPEVGGLVVRMLKAAGYEDKLDIMIGGGSSGDPDEGERLLQTLLDSLPEPDTKVLAKGVSFLGAMEGLMGLPLAGPFHTRAAHRYKSALLSHDFNEAAVRAALEKVVSGLDMFPHDKKTMFAFMIELLGGNDSKVNKISKDAASWPFRNVASHVWVEVKDEDLDELPQSAWDWAADVHAAFVKNLDHDYDAYINYADLEVDPRRYYGDSLPRLKALKQKIDPDNLFSTPMGIVADSQNSLPVGDEQLYA